MTVLQAVLLLSGLRLAAVDAAPSPETGGEKPYEGRVLEVLTFHDPQAEALFAEIRHFEQTTGAHVKLTQVRHPEMVAWTDWAERMTAFDVVTVDEPHLAEIAPFLLERQDWPTPVLHAEVDAAEAWHSPALEASSVDGTLLGVPVNPNLFLYVYRKDLFGDPVERERFRDTFGAELEPPRDAKEFRRICAFFHRPPELYGFAPVRETSEGGTVELVWLLALFDQRLFDADLRPAFDPVVAGRALVWYGDLLEFAPASEGDWHYEARTDLLRTGRLAHGMFWPAYLPDALNPADSEVVSRLGFAPGPHSLDGEPVNVTGFWTVAIPKASKNQDLAAEFAAFWSSRRTNVGLLRKGAVPSRADVIGDPRLAKSFPWRDAYAAALGKTTSRPVHRQYRKISARVAAVFDAFVEGRSTVEETVAALERIGGDHSEPEGAR